ncbi:MAG: hypothetical protein EA351_10340 [Gemmatimonadales bacterium]|nr:MAG: hypothetical protein EA351_10340 [Gemmatimonadales bacterium]
MRLTFATLIALAVALLLAGCDSTEPTPRGTLQGVVLAEGSPLAGVIVEVSGPRTDQVTTDEAGRYAFQELPSGAYVVSIRNVPSDAAFPATSRAAAVPEGGAITVDFQGNFIRTAAIVGTVTSREQGLPGISVRLEGTESRTTQTDSEGEFRFSAMRAGSYTVEISGFPASVNFPTPRTEVELATGQTHVATFEGIPELTASVVIRSVQRRTSAGTLEGVDPDDVRGRIEVNVAIDRGLDRPDSLLVLLGGQVVGRQSFQESGGVELSAATTQELSFPVNTAAFDEETGVPRFLNGQRTLTVRLATREGGSSASSASTPLTLRNQDTFMGRVEPGVGPVLGDDGETWVGGDLVVDVLPVIYSPGRDVSTVQLELRRSGGAQVARQSLAGSPPFRFVLSPGATDVSSLSGYQTPRGAIDQLRVIAAAYSQGGPVGGLPVVVGDSLRVDQVAPEATSFEFPAQGSQATCCSQNWVGATFPFALAIGESEDSGVGGVTFRVHAGDATLTNSQLLARTPVEVGAELAETGSNAAYRAVVVLSDALSNERVVALQPTSANPLSNERGGIFGVDRTPPLATLVDAADALGMREINPASGSAWVLTAVDERSGIAGTPFRTVVERYAPQLGTEPVCIFPVSGPCSPSPDGFIRDLPDSGDGYFRLTTRALDRGGNHSEPVVAWVLRDPTPPELLSLQVPSSVSAGEEMTVTGQARDNIDLFYGQAAIRFGDPGSPAGILPFAAPEFLGEPFSGALVPEASFQLRMPVVVGLEVVNSSGAPSGAVDLATQITGSAVDAAGARGTRVAAIPGSPEFEARSFRVQDRGASGGVARWELEASGPVVCGPGLAGTGEGPCPESAAESITLSARASGAAGEFERPFTTVHMLALMPDGAAVWLGSSSTGEMVQDGTGVQGRVWRWSFEWTPDPRIPAGAQRLIAVGVDAHGAALRSSDLTSVEVVTGGG